MSNFVTRRFTTDCENIYFINDGIITTKKISSFIRNCKDAYNILQNTGDNVGWCTPGTCLMFTEDNKIYRVRSDIFEGIVNYKSTCTKTCFEDDVVSVRYDTDIYSDTLIIADIDYKNFGTRGSNTETIWHISEESNRIGFAKCIMIQDPLSVYFIKDGKLSREHILDYMAEHNENWEEHLMSSGQDLGFTIGSTTDCLLVLENEICLMEDWLRISMMADEDTMVEVKSTCTYDFLIVDYDSVKFPKDMILSQCKKYKKGK